MRKAFLCVGLVVALAVMSICVGLAAVPGAVSYQGKLTDSTGKPVPDGSYQLAFKLYSVPSGPNAPIWTSATTAVNTQGGVFTTTLSPPASAFNSGSGWLEMVVGGQTLSPRTQLLTVPYAFHAGLSDEAIIADSVPDGSISASKLAPDMPYARLPYVQGIQSGLDPTLTMQVLIDGTVQTPTPVLAEPYTEGVGVITYRPAVGSPRLIPGSPYAGQVVLRRPRSSDLSWEQWGLTVLTGTSGSTSHTVELDLMHGTTRVCDWIFRNTIVSSYNLVLGDDGIPQEQITFEADPTLKVERDDRAVLPSSLPKITGLQRGFTSDLASETCTVAISGTSEPYFAVGSDSGWGAEVTTYTDGTTGQTHKTLGATHTNYLTLLQNPSAPADLQSWYLSLIQGTLTRKSVALGLSGTLNQQLVEYSGAWPHSYTLMMGDDGLPVEEYQVVFDQVLIP